MEMYVVYKFDSIHCTWNYINSFYNYEDANDEITRLTRLWNGEYKIEFEEV